MWSYISPSPLLWASRVARARPDSAARVRSFFGESRSRRAQGSRFSIAANEGMTAINICMFVSQLSMDRTIILHRLLRTSSSVHSVMWMVFLYSLSIEFETFIMLYGDEHFPFEYFIGKVIPKCQDAETCMVNTTSLSPDRCRLRTSTTIFSGYPISHRKLSRTTSRPANPRRISRHISRLSRVGSTRERPHRSRPSQAHRTAKAGHVRGHPTLYGIHFGIGYISDWSTHSWDKRCRVQCSHQDWSSWWQSSHSRFQWEYRISAVQPLGGDGEREWALRNILSSVPHPLHDLKWLNHFRPNLRYVIQKKLHLAGLFV
jgi:hypothetical protein